MKPYPVSLQCALPALARRNCKAGFVVTGPARSAMAAQYCPGQACDVPLRAYFDSTSMSDTAAGC